MADNDLSIHSPVNMPVHSLFDVCTGQRKTSSILPEIIKMSVAERALVQLNAPQQHAFLKRQFNHSINFIADKTGELADSSSARAASSKKFCAPPTLQPIERKTRNDSHAASQGSGSQQLLKQLESTMRLLNKQKTLI